MHSPHANGVLMEYHLKDDHLIPEHGITGVTNHVAGSRDQGMAALMDANGDGITDVLIPSSDRRSLRVLGFHSGIPLEFARFNLPSPAAGNFTIITPDILAIPLEDGRHLRVEWR